MTDAFLNRLHLLPELHLVLNYAVALDVQVVSVRVDEHVCRQHGHVYVFIHVAHHQNRLPNSKSQLYVVPELCYHFIPPTGGRSSADFIRISSTQDCRSSKKRTSGLGLPLSPAS